MKKFKRLFAALVAAAMMMALCCVSAFAEEPAAASNPSIVKTVIVDDDVDITDAVFTFTVTPQESAPAIATDNKVTISGTSFVKGSESGKRTASVDIATLDAIKTALASQPVGVYKYKIDEATAPSKWQENSTADYTLIVNKYNDGSVSTTIADNSKQSTDADYKVSAAAFENENTETYSLTINKNIEDNSLVKDYRFEIAVTFDKDVSVTVDGATEKTNFTKGTPVTFTLAENKQSINITGLPAGVKYTVVESGVKNAKSTTYTITDGTTNAVTTNKAEDTLLKNATVTIENTFDQAQTGVLTRIMPFVAMIIAAGAAAAAYFVIARKRRAED